MRSVDLAIATVCILFCLPMIGQTGGATCDELVCNGNLQISISADCALEVTPDMLLENPAPFGDYVIIFYDENGNAIGDVLTGAQSGKTLSYKVLCGGNSCWGNATIEANIIPSIPAACSCEENGGTIPAQCNLWCGSEDAIPGIIVTPEEAAAFFGNCGPELLGNIVVQETRSGDLCSNEGEVITISYTGKVLLHGRVQVIDILCQSYSIQALDIDLSESEFNENFGFPNDVILNCGTGSDPQDIYEATMSIENAFPYYVDMHNFVIDTTFVFDTVMVVDESQQITRDTMVQQDIDNDGDFEWVRVTIVDKGFKEEIIIDTIIGGPVNPSVPITKQVCNILTSYSDLEFEACGNGTKIIRNWSMVDWCDGQITRSDRQTIEIRDLSAPVVFDEENGELVPVNRLDDVVVSIDPWVCSSKARLPVLTIQDNCDTAPTVDWFSAEGRIDEGFILDLWIGNGPITVYGTVSDDCGNTSDISFNIIVIDEVPPVPIAETNIQVSLTSGASGEDAIAKVYAETFDEGSHDAGCGPVDIYVVRMDDWSTPVVDCNGNIVGYQPVSCGPQTEAIDLGLGGFKDAECTYNGTNVKEITALGDFVKFCCEDVGQEIMVIMIVQDAAGNTNQAMVSVEVVDKATPDLFCEDIEIDCGDDLDEVPGPRLIGGLCSNEDYTIELINESDRSGACGAGDITREYFVDLDGDGTLSPGDLFCEQVISKTDESSRFDPYTIKWPKHHNGLSLVGVNLECGPLGTVAETAITVDMGASMLCTPATPEEGESGTPIWCDTDCGLIGYSMEVDTIDSFDACLKIIRRWTVVDWCVWESNGGDIDDENDTDTDQFEAVEDWAQGVCADCVNGNGPVSDDPVYFRYTDVDEDGYYTFDQIIKVIDDTAPEINAPTEIVVNITGGAQTKDDDTDCEGSEVIDATAVDFCGSDATTSPLVWNIKVEDAFGNPVNNDTGTNLKQVIGTAASMNTRNGGQGDVYTITWRVTDGCGNSTSARTTVRFEDNKAPTPFCVSGLTTALMQPDGTATIWANEFDFGSFDNCCPAEDLRFSIVESGETPIRPEDFGFGSQGSITFDCNDLQATCTIDGPVQFEYNERDFNFPGNSDISVGNDDCGFSAQFRIPDINWGFDNDIAGPSTIDRSLPDTDGDQSVLVMSTPLDGTLDNNDPNVVEIEFSTCQLNVEFGIADIDFADVVAVIAFSAEGDTIFPSIAPVSGFNPSWIAYDPFSNQNVNPVPQPSFNTNNPLPGYLSIVGGTDNYNDARSTVLFNFGGQCVQSVKILSGYLDDDGWYDLPDSDELGPISGRSQSNGFVQLSEFSVPTPSSANASNFRNLDIWIWDCDGNGDFCTVGLLLGGDCATDGDGSHAMIAGNVSTAYDDMIENAEVSLLAALPEYPVSMMTSNNGAYAFENNVLAANYTLSVAKNDNHINGVSTRDLVDMQRHILGVKTFESPFQLIAADVSNDERITTLDIFEAKKLILGITTEFSNNQSWRFIDKSESFYDPTEPFPFAEQQNILELQENMMSEDFIGVKIGDVTNDAIANNLMPIEHRSNESLTLIAENVAVRSGELIKVAIGADNFSDIYGFQFTLEHYGMQFAGIEAGALDIDEHDIAVNEGTLSLSWHSAQAIYTSETLFTISFIVSKAGKLSNQLQMSSAITKIESYKGSDLEVQNILLNFIDENGEASLSALALHQNEPNPFKKQTVLSFTMPDAGSATLRIMNVAGQLIHQVDGSYEKGYQEVIITSADLGTSGVLYYQLQSGTSSITKKMIVID